VLIFYQLKYDLTTQSVCLHKAQAKRIVIKVWLTKLSKMHLII